MPGMSKIENVCVYCGSRNGTDPAFVAAARRLGRLFAENHIGLVYGGGSNGLMGAVADAVVDHGGRVIGVIPEFLRKWEEGHAIVIGVKNKSRENPLMFMLRKIFYSIIKRISDTEHIKNFTGFGLYDKRFMDVLRNLPEPYPYFRGLVAELGFDIVKIPYVQPRRERGKTKNNFYTLYDIAMLGFVNHSKVPLRLASFIGFGVALVSLLVAIGYFVYKLTAWNDFQLGSAPLIIGLFFFAAVQLFFIGIIGEYVGAIFTQVKQRPLVIEKERINFAPSPASKKRPRP